MPQYTLKIVGWELNGSGHNLSDDEVNILKEYQLDMDIDDLSDIGYGLEDVIDGYSPFEVNMWTIAKPLNITDKTYFVLENDKGETIFDTNIQSIKEVFDVDSDYEYDQVLQGYPDEDVNQNILLFMEENKGVVCNYNFNSDEVPKPEDFYYAGNSIETPDGDWDYIDKVFYNGSELEIEYDQQWVRGKSLTVELWTLKDIE